MVERRRIIQECFSLFCTIALYTNIVHETLKCIVPVSNIAMQLYCKYHTVIQLFTCCWHGDRNKQTTLI